VTCQIKRKPSAVDNGRYGGEYIAVMANYAVGNGVDMEELARNVNDCAVQHLPTTFLMLGVSACGSNVVRCYYRVASFRS